MNHSFLKTTGALALSALITTAAMSQGDKTKETTVTGRSRSTDVIEIRPKVNVDTKITVEIKGTDVKINGKPLSEFNSDEVDISKRKNVGDVIVEGYHTEPNRFRGGGVNVYSSPNGINRVYAGANKAFLGVSTERASDGEGVMVTNVTDGSAAEKAGLKEDDIITKINDSKVTSPAELTRAIGKFNPDEKITVTYKRDKKEQKTSAVLTKNKNTGAYTLNAPNYEVFRNFNLDNNFSLNWNGKPKLGLKAQETEDGKGLKVLDVDDESAAEKAGIKEGDIITSFDGNEVNTVEKLGEVARPAIDKGNFKVKLLREGKAQELDVKIPKKLKTTNL